MELGESHDFNWVDRGWEAIFFFVCFSYVSQAALKMVLKSVEGVSVCGTWDMRFVEGYSVNQILRGVR